MHRFASIQFVEAQLCSGSPPGSPYYRSEFRRQVGNNANPLGNMQFKASSFRSILKDRCAKCDTSVTVAKIRLAERSISPLAQMDFRRPDDRGERRPLLFLYQRGHTTYLASICRPRIECGWIAILAITNEIERSYAASRRRHLLEAAPETASRRRTRARRRSASFRFIPRELAIKCRRLIESYHAIYGDAGLPDILWLPDMLVVVRRARHHRA